MAIATIVFGGVSIVDASLDLADLLTFLLFVGILIEPINRFAQFRSGSTRKASLVLTGLWKF